LLLLLLVMLLLLVNCSPAHCQAVWFPANERAIAQDPCYSLPLLLLLLS
jgi:hypothetical protein